nr:MAG TPA: hypothetical protein [Caudoviricetes sp.]
MVTSPRRRLGGLTNGQAAAVGGEIDGAADELSVEHAFSYL